MTNKFIMIASSKGGVGKSTASLGIAAALANKGRRVLLCDLDFGNACLDILLGVQDSVLCTIQDVALGTVAAERALINIDLPERNEKRKKIFSKEDGSLIFLPCAVGTAQNISESEDAGAINAHNICLAFKDAAEYAKADYVIMDTGAGANSVVRSVARLCDMALVITGQMPVALRSAEKTVTRLTELDVPDIRIIINNFDAQGVINESRRGLFTVIDESKAHLAGVIPYDYSLMLMHERLLLRPGDSKIAFENIAARIEGDNIPVFSGIKKLRKLKKKICQ